MNRYVFWVELSGIGETPDEAWEDVIENAVLDNPAICEVISVEDIDEN